MKNMMLIVALTVLTAPGFAGRTTGQAIVIKVKPGELVIDHPTLINLGFEWVIQGDDNRNANVDVSYRKQGEAVWKQGLPVAIDFYNNYLTNFHDNAVEIDGSMHNVRVMRNLMVNSVSHPFCNQPAIGGPIYFSSRHLQRQHEYQLQLIGLQRVSTERRSGVLIRVELAAKGHARRLQRPDFRRWAREPSVEHESRGAQVPHAH